MRSVSCAPKHYQIDDGDATLGKQGTKLLMRVRVVV
jgi:hypothetical protein